MSAAERFRLLAALRRELLGPRGGPHELLPIDPTTANPVDPRQEYLTGVLDPGISDSDEDHNPEADAASMEIAPPETPADQAPAPDAPFDEPSEPEVILPPAYALSSPSLDGRRLPRSAGLSFVVRCSDPRAVIGVLVTYGNYRLEGGQWCREPRWFEAQLEIGRDSSHEHRNEDVAVRLYAFQRKLSADLHRVSLFLVNESSMPKVVPFYERTVFRVFQPQIRVRLARQIQLVPLGKSDDGGFNDRPAFARGHMTGAIWASVDYAAEASGTDWLLESWPDGETVPPLIRGRFSTPTVRTDYMPSYNVFAPSLDWRGGGDPPELRAEQLAEITTAAEIRRALTPIAAGYLNWIEEVKKVSSFDSGACEEAARRISAGVELLAQDENARLAWCFANKAISLQAMWRDKSKGGAHLGFRWYPFQAAFILMNLPGLVDPSHGEREVCDVLWFPTGGGKTEAYLGLAAFVLAYRRLGEPEGSMRGYGVGVLSRYTLRLLTIQQFRRAARLITACEYLRVVETSDGKCGWRPTQARSNRDCLWGHERFSLGLWVGGGVTPNQMFSFDARTERGRMLRFAGAFECLEGAAFPYSGPNESLRKRLQGRELRGVGSEPAQLVKCPACEALLTIPAPALPAGQHELHFIVWAPRSPSALSAADLTHGALNVTDAGLASLRNGRTGYRIVTIRIGVGPEDRVSEVQVDRWFEEILKPRLGDGARLASVRASRMGYFFIRPPALMKVKEPALDFAVFCPSPRCPLADRTWSERVPLSLSGKPQADPTAGPGLLPEPFVHASQPFVSTRIPIPVYTVDEQIYARCPSMIVATVDKFARLAHEPRAAGMFGNVEFYHALWGYYRQGVPPSLSSMRRAPTDHPLNVPSWGQLRVPVEPFDPPTLIIQDELHLIEGPLGSMVGAYEPIVDEAIKGAAGRLAKYIASSATINRADVQVRSVFDRTASIFPPPGPRMQDNFFSCSSELHPTTEGSGRLYVGVACPGWGAYTPVVRTWSSLLLQVNADRASGVPDDQLDPYWTLVGYFNAIRELAGARALYQADIHQRIRDPMVLVSYGGTTRAVSADLLEASGRTDSIELPRILEQLEIRLGSGDASDALATTSMFGTGVDVTRLGLMIVHGQPKTTAAYIQATGRVGRQSAGLVITLLRPTRPRDLDHYEFFIGYHRALHRWVEPITVTPKAPRARERTLGPVQVAMLRQSQVIDGVPVPAHWRREQRLAGDRYDSSANRMASERNTPIMTAIGQVLETRAATQPGNPIAGTVANEAGHALDQWRSVAQRAGTSDDVVYVEPGTFRAVSRHVILGDPSHDRAVSSGILQAFRNAPQSLREVEESTGIWVP